MTCDFRGTHARGHRVHATRSITLLFCLSLAACSTGPDKDEIAQLGKDAAAFRAETEAASPVGASDAAASRAVVVERLVTGGPIRLNYDCGAFVTNAERELVEARDAAAEDAAYRKVKLARACTLDDTTWTAESAGSPPDGPEIWGALNDYLDGLQAIVDAGDATGVAEAVDRLDKSAEALAAAAHAPPPLQAAPGFAAKLAQLALANAQYRALRHVVLKVDPLLDPARPDLTRALRIRRARWIAEVAANATKAANASLGLLNHPAVRRNPDRRLAYYDRMQPILADLATQQAAVQSDPRRTVDALIKAHHKLAAVLRSNKGQLGSVLSAVTDIAAGAEAVANAGK